MYALGTACCQHIHRSWIRCWVLSVICVQSGSIVVAGWNHRRHNDQRPSASNRRKRSTHGLRLQPPRRALEHLRRWIPEERPDPGEDPRDPHGRTDRGLRDRRQPRQSLELWRVQRSRRSSPTVTRESFPTVVKSLIRGDCKLTADKMPYRPPG